MSKSERFYWCTGCGKWHDFTKPQASHFLMYCEWEEPCLANFEGTPEELQRFLIARDLRALDDEAFERRIDALVSPEPSR